jgi:signal transduction histidine kinase
MSEQLGHYEEQVRRSERLRTLGQLGAGIAHQLRNSATGARLALEFHAAEIPPTIDRESLDVALRQLDLMETSLKRFLRLGRGEQVPTEEVALGKLIEETLPLIEPSCRHAGLVLEWEPPRDEIVLNGDADSLRQLLLNLLVNAVEATTSASGQRGVVRVELVRTIDGYVVLRVLDTGPGPAPEIASQLFEPFATSKPDGTGLGLSVAQEIAMAHGATLSWRREGMQTCFELRITPRTASAAS